MTRWWLLPLLFLLPMLATCGRDEPGATNPTHVSSAPGATSTVTPSATATASAKAGEPTPASSLAGATHAPPPPPATSAVPKTLLLQSALGGKRFPRPIELGAFPDNRVFVAEQDGLVTLYALDGRETGTLFDIRSQVSRAGNEEGLLSLALAPRFPADPYLYTYYSVAGGERRTRLSRFQVVGDAVAGGSELVILEVAQPFSNHKGGAIRFGPDGMLYLGLGDGGSANDPGNRAQNLDVLLGKMLRLDVSRARTGATYEVPADNPFVGQSGARGEVWAYGLRNPWRSAFDPATGLLWVADVGQNAVEEVAVVRRGENHGWPQFEGNNCIKSCDRDGRTFPLAAYTHAEGCSITGGVVYRGRAVPGLVGWYLYADFCSGRVWALSAAGGMPVQLLGPVGGRSIASFGTDASGEVYLLIHGGAVQRVVGVE